MISRNSADFLRNRARRLGPGLRYKPEFADISSWMKNNEIHVVGKTGTAQVVRCLKTFSIYMTSRVSPMSKEIMPGSWDYFPKKNPK